MGDILSTPSPPSPNTNPNPAQNSIPMSPSSEIPKTQESKSPTETLESPNHQEPEKAVQETQQDLTLVDPVQENRQDGGGGGGEEEEGECPFCLYMKGGECRETFIGWEKCVEEGEKNKENIVDKCYEATAALKKCMESHPDYYGPILNAEKAAEKEAIREMEKVKAEEQAFVDELEKEHEGERTKDEPSDNRDKQSESS